VHIKVLTKNIFKQVKIILLWIRVPVLYSIYFVIYKKYHYVIVQLLFIDYCKTIFELEFF
jgi:hypothetical protein